MVSAKETQAVAAIWTPRRIRPISSSPKLRIETKTKGHNSKAILHPVAVIDVYFEYLTGLLIRRPDSEIISRNKRRIGQEYVGGIVNGIIFSSRARTLRLDSSCKTLGPFLSSDMWRNDRIIKTKVNCYFLRPSSGRDRASRR